MGARSDDLFAAVYSYLADRSDFDELYQLAVELLPGVADDEVSVSARLARLVVAVEAEEASGEYSAAERRSRIMLFVMAPQVVSIALDTTLVTGVDTKTLISRLGPEVSEVAVQAEVEPSGASGRSLETVIA